MNVSRRRVLAVTRKELREYRRNGSLVAGMAIVPLLVCLQPLIDVFGLSSSASATLRHEHALLYLLAIPAVVPAFVAAYSVVGERQQGTLEPVLTTPVRREEFLLGKALAALLPSVAVGYVVYAVFLALAEALAQPGVASALVRVPDVAAQVLFTPLIAGWTIWISIAISTRSTDPRTAQQLGALAGLPSVAVSTLIAFNVIRPSVALGATAMAVLLLLNGLGWRATSALFDRERLIAGPR